MIVEDVYLLADEIKRELLKAGFEVVSFGSSGPALDFLKRGGKVDIIITDLFMQPRGIDTGVEFIEKIASGESTRGIGVLIYSAFAPYLKTRLRQDSGTAQTPILVLSNFAKYLLKDPETYEREPIIINGKVVERYYPAEKVQEFVTRMKEAGLSENDLLAKADTKPCDLVSIIKRRAGLQHE
jgi:CheY-like chemotaxis protein